MIASDDNLDFAKVANDVADILELSVSDPLSAADLLDDWAKQLQKVASQLRVVAAETIEDESDGIESVSGFGDKVFAKVYGPDGKLRARGRS